MFLGRLNKEVTTTDSLKAHLSAIGKVTNVVLVKNKNEKSPNFGKSRGYGFAEFETGEDLQTAYKALKDSEIDGTIWRHGVNGAGQGRAPLTVQNHAQGNPAPRQQAVHTTPETMTAHTQVQGTLSSSTYK